MTERAQEVRETCANYPHLSLPALPAQPSTDLGSSAVKGSVTREKSSAAPTDEPEAERWLVAIRRTYAHTTVIGYTPDPVAAILRGKPWATLIRGHGWTFPNQYLEHVERLLDAALVDLYDVDGEATPKQRREQRRDQRIATQRLIDGMRTSAEAACSPEAVKAREECRAAFAAVIPDKTSDEGAA